MENLKNNSKYSFECNMTKEEYAEQENLDEWGCAYVWFGDNVGAEYNFCVIDGENFCAIYKMSFNNVEDCIETDYDTNVHYEIDFNNDRWMENLEDAMCNALIEFMS